MRDEGRSTVEEEGLLKLRWLGTAAFEVCLDQAVILIDPYFSRNAQARPVLTLCPAEVTRADFIFLPHGHFDHSETAL